MRWIALLMDLFDRGGGMKKNTAGDLVQAEDQASENSQLKNLRVAMGLQHPIVLIVGT